MATDDVNQNRPLTGFPYLFANNINVGTTLTEVVFTFSIGNVPSNIMYVPLPVAKHMSKLLNETLADYESKMGQEIVSVDDLFKQIQKSEENAGKPSDNNQS